MKLNRPHAAASLFPILILLLSGACMLVPPSPLAQDLRRVKPGMSPEQVEAILGQYRGQVMDRPAASPKTRARRPPTPWAGSTRA